LQAVNTEGLEPLVNVCDFPLPLREDKVTDGALDDIFANAPQELYRHFAVPKVIE
jgi:aspartyl/glutamyl-tRNA(Asn/Gln) amidotransferase C subunit